MVYENNRMNNEKPSKGYQKRKFFNNKNRWVGYKRKRSAVGNEQPERELSAPKSHTTDDDESDGTVTCPLSGWKIYFPEEVYSEDSNTIRKVKTVENFMQKNHSMFCFTTIEANRSFQFDLKLVNDDEFKTWPEFHSDLYNLPDYTIKCIGLAMHTIISTNIQNEIKLNKLGIQCKNEYLAIPMIRARIINFDGVIQLKQLRANYYGKLVSVKGTVIRIGNIKLICITMAFQCKQCGVIQCKKQCEGVYNIPCMCKAKGCRSQSFIPLFSSSLTQTINFQCVRIQEIISEEHRDGGRIPRTMDCELTADLVDSCSPGDIVILNGIVKTRNNDEGTKYKTGVFQIYLDVVSVINSKTLSISGKSTVEFNLKDYYAIKGIHSEENLFRLVVQSLCPSIYGHEVVKAGLILCMFGGCQKYQDSRAEPHILIVGDPGLGKSRLLQACASVAPRGVYVCGNTSTSSGLTVTLSRESGGDYTLEAGALVLCDQGCCCIDEFDKMTSQHQALLEAMEQQTVSIAKAGVVCSLPARASILAAANPVGGHYNKAKTVSENLKMGSALLSRFDLVFILLDQPNEELDSMLSEHVMALHSGLRTSKAAVSEGSPTGSICSINEGSIYERLKVQRSEELDLIPHVLLRKYIAYARKYVKPKLTSEAVQILQKFYLDLRKLHESADCTPVTTRQLESLIRLTEARAKIELREEATKYDALDVVEILKYSMWDTYTDDLGVLDFKRSQHGSGMSSANQAKRFLRLLQRRSELQSRSIFSVRELQDICRTAQVQVPDFHNFLSVLNVQGFLLKKGNETYQVLSAG